MIRFLHTADWHIAQGYKRLAGSKIEDSGIYYVRDNITNTINDIKLKTARDIIAIANKEKVDFVIIAGDLFDSNNVDDKYISKVIDVLSECNTTVYILPANHDPLTKDSVYNKTIWNNLKNIHIFRENKQIIHNNTGVLLYPCVMKQSYYITDPTSWIKLDKDNISIAIAHGNANIIEETTKTPIDIGVVNRLGLDFLALGEWHTYREFKAKDGKVRAIYPGSIEPTEKPNHDRKGGAIAIVEIDENSRDINIHKINVGYINWIVREYNNITDNILKEIDMEIGKMDNIIFEAILNGDLTKDIQSNFENIIEKHKNNLLYVNIAIKFESRQLNIEKIKNKLNGNILANIVDQLIEMKKGNIVSDKYIDDILNNNDNINSIDIIDRALYIIYNETQN